MSPFLQVRCLLLLSCLVVSHTDLYMEKACRNSVTYLFGPDAGILPTSGDHSRPTADQHGKLSYQMSHDSHTYIQLGELPLQTLYVQRDLMQFRQALDNATRMLNNIDEILEARKQQDPPKLACRSGYSLHKNMCYKAFTKPVTEFRAYIFCIGEECGELAKPRTEDIDKFLIALKNAADPKSNFWVGLQRHNSNREMFHWKGNASDIVAMNTSYTNWAPGRPNDEKGYDDDCVFYVAKTSEFPDTWAHDSCFTSLPFLCSKKP